MKRVDSETRAAIEELLATQMELCAATLELAEAMILRLKPSLFASRTARSDRLMVLAEIRKRIRQMPDRQRIETLLRSLAPDKGDAGRAGRFSASAGQDA